MAEALGRLLLGYQAPAIDHWFEPGEILPSIWGGLQVIALPGHTAGHSGFLSTSQSTLFAGDLFSAYRNRPRLAPSFFNTDTIQASASVVEASDLACQHKLSRVVLNHSSPAADELHLKQLSALAIELRRPGKSSVSPRQE